VELNPGDHGALTTLPELPALLASWPRTVLTEHAGLLHELSDAIAGPYHLVFPEQFDTNLCAFRAALRDCGVEGRVYFAKKANKAATWMRRCAELGAGADVASMGELRDALGHGVRGDNLVITGPAKSDELLRLGILHGSLVAVDSEDELARCIRLAERLGPARLLLRLLPPDQPASRFGMTCAELERAVDSCVAAGPVLRCEGFSFHLSGYSVAQRADLAGVAIRWCRQASERGLPAWSLSMGGGFAVNYVAAADWQRFCAGHRAGDFHAGKTFPGFYPYHSPVAGADALRAILNATPAAETASLATLLRRAGITLLVEPGRALLDQAGCTVLRVQDVKSREHGIVTVDGTSLSLSEQWFNSEFLPDPLLVPQHRSTGSGTPFAACVAGVSCLESDMLTWRKIVFPDRPQVGDLLVYPNTAGYQMDSNESRFHELPLPPKIAVSPSGSSVRWWFDRHPS
jgi:diaminopimelate decarboxylase